MKLIVDSREPENILERSKIIMNGFDILSEALPVGDFVCGDVVVEFKRGQDLINSTFSQHLKKQVMQMQQFKHSFLILVGHYEEFISPAWSWDHHYGIIASVCINSNTKVFQVENDLQALRLCKKLFEKAESPKEYKLEDTELMRDKMSIEDYKLKMLCVFPNIGVKRGKKLLEKADVVQSVDDFFCRMKNLGVMKYEFFEKVIKK